MAAMSVQKQPLRADRVRVIAPTARDVPRYPRQLLAPLPRTRLGAMIHAPVAAGKSIRSATERKIPAIEGQRREVKHYTTSLRCPSIYNFGVIYNLTTFEAICWTL